MDKQLTRADQMKIMEVAKDFATACEAKNLNEDDTKELVLEVMRATAQTLLEDKK
jgi:hypothetical protein